MSTRSRQIGKWRSSFDSSSNSSNNSNKITNESLNHVNLEPQRVSLHVLDTDADKIMIHDTPYSVHAIDNDYPMTYMVLY